MESSRPARSFFGKAYDVLSGFGIATITLLLLGLLTWFATLEQIEAGLYPTLHKYFDWRSVFVLPEINGKLVPLPLPGGYWVCALLLLNLILGGVIRIRKGWKHAGNLISHFGIVLLLIAGGVAHHYSQRGNMAVGEGESSNVAEDYFEYVIEVAEIKNGLPDSKIQVIRGKYLTDLTEGNIRTFRFPELPFDIQVTGYAENCVPAGSHEIVPRNGEPIIEGYYLMAKKTETQAESNTAGCYARLLNHDGTNGDIFILAGASFHPYTVKAGDRVFTIDMRKRLWEMPFTVRLDHFTAEFHPGITRPKKFVSEITRLENGGEAKVTIQMNEPMRYEGLTFFQASYGPPGAGPGQKLFSVFEIVHNPADKWPEYSLYIVAFGMLVTFLMKLGVFLTAIACKKKRHV
ncbi:MAG: cytochrome c biogenesis protein ResB [Luteolibacter sp.]